MLALVSVLLAYGSGLGVRNRKEPSLPKDAVLELEGKAVVVEGAQNASSSVLMEPPVSSPGDERIYRRLVLKNGLGVLMASDPNPPLQAYVSLSVGTGSFADPDLPGLAHFLEHMLFLGSEKYPSEDDGFSAFVSAHGGDDNAFTAKEETAFYFNVHYKSFAEAMDRFSQFFISPLLTKEASGDEMNAVNAEHVKNLQSDEWREQQLVDSLTNPHLPVHKFSTGDLQTLGAVSTTELHERLMAFWKEHYRASNMNLAIISPYPLDVLQPFVEKLFQHLPESSPTPPAQHEALLLQQDQSADYFLPEALGSMYTFEMVQNRRSLSLLWAMPPVQSSDVLRDAVAFISVILGDESKGSLAQVLYDNGWVRSQSVGLMESFSFASVFELNVELSEEGFQYQQEILQICLYTISRLLLAAEQGDRLQPLFLQQQQIAELAWQYKQDDNMEYVQTLSGNMRLGRGVDLIIAEQLWGNWSTELSASIVQLLQFMRPEKMVVVSGAPLEDLQDVHLDLTEPIYGTHYRHDVFTAQQLKLLQDAAAGIVTGIAAELVGDCADDDDDTSQGGKAGGKTGEEEADCGGLRVPGALNSFLPDKHSLETGSDTVDRDYSFGPALLQERGGQGQAVRTWYVSDHEDCYKNICSPFLTVVCNLFALHPQEEHSLSKEVASNIFVALLRQLGHAADYPASEAGGYSDMHVFRKFLRQVVARLGSPEWVLSELEQMVQTEGGVGLLERIKAARYDQAHNDLFKSPIHLIENFIQRVQVSPSWPLDSEMETIAATGLDEAVEWARQLLFSSGLECMVSGEVTEDEALDLVQLVQTLLPYTSESENIAAASLFTPGGSRVPPFLAGRSKDITEGRYRLSTKGFNPDERNSAVVHIYRISAVSPDPFSSVLITSELRLLFDLLAFVLEQPAFVELRTKEQLGYIVWSWDVTPLSSPEALLNIGVQSAVYPAEEVSKRISAFLAEFVCELHDSMTQRRYSQVVSQVLKQKLNGLGSPGDRVREWWLQIRLRQYNFNVPDEQSAALYPSGRLAHLSIFQHFLRIAFPGLGLRPGVASNCSALGHAWLDPSQPAVRPHSDASAETVMDWLGGVVKLHVSHLEALLRSAKDPVTMQTTQTTHPPELEALVENGPASGQTKPENVDATSKEKTSASQSLQTPQEVSADAALGAHANLRPSQQYRPPKAQKQQHQQQVLSPVSNEAGSSHRRRQTSVAAQLRGSHEVGLSTMESHANVASTNTVKKMNWRKLCEEHSVEWQTGSLFSQDFTYSTEYNFHSFSTATDGERLLQPVQSGILPPAPIDRAYLVAAVVSAASDSADSSAASPEPAS
eukprot:g70974.t1